MSDSVEPPNPVAAAPPEDIPGGSQPFDERLSPAGANRPHWEPLMGVLGRLGPDEVGARAGDIRRVLAENGVSCFVHRGSGVEEPWRLDPLPLVLAQEDWRRLEAGLIQRARLLNLALQDLYGTQHLVRDGLVPAALLYANPNFLRPCQAMRIKDGVYLHVYAADLGRSPDGAWWVLADRTQTPTGLGFALENRAVLSRVLPELMREIRPRPVADLLGIWRETLRHFAPSQTEQPSIVLLTPGPRNEAYFEHVFLSRLLGLTLVEGDDLTVRDRRLFVKTLDGLRRADVVMRRVSDAFCDPLELRDDSLLGVPGLVEAARAGHITLANPLGSGLLESPAFLPFLPGISRHLLGEDLLLPSIGTWWCGQAAEQSYVREHLGRLEVRPAFDFGGDGPPWSKMDLDARGQALERIRLRPHEFVGQEPVHLSRAPVWTREGTLAAQPLILRMLVLHDGRDFVVMPGGVARIVEQDKAASSALSLAGLTKDVWVLPEDLEPGLGPQAVVELGLSVERATSDLPSRTADNFFWLGRYTERLEQAVRTTRQVLGRLGEDSPARNRNQLGALRSLLEQLRLVPASATGQDSREGLQRDVLRLLFEGSVPGGIKDLIKRIYQAAFAVRDRLSADTWRLLNGLEADSRAQMSGLPLMQARAVLRTLIRDLAALSGMETENMTRGHGWAFLDTGRRIERGISTACLAQVLVKREGATQPLLDLALEIADSVMTHRRRYFAEPRLTSVLEVLIEDPANPRSLAFQLTSLKNHAATLPSGADPEGVAIARRKVEELVTRLCPEFWSGGGAGLREASMDAMLADISAGLEELSELLTQVYFSHVTPRVS